jgi:membrane-bound ClpP family serine protease
MLSGHAILIAIAANQIAMDENTALRAAGIDEPKIDNLVREVYRGVASQRLIFPVPMVMALLDQDRDLYRVQTDIGPVFVDGEELVKLEQENKATETTTLTKPGNPIELTSQDLESFSLIRRPVKSKKELAVSLDLAPQALDQSPQFVGQWRAIQVNLPSYIDDRTATWVMRSLGLRLSQSQPPNLLILNLDNTSTEGSVDACLKLAQYLVELDSNEVQTAVFVRGAVKGPAAVLALTGNQLLMANTAKLGGKLTELDQSRFTKDALADLEAEIKSLARARQVDWSLLMSMLNPELEINRYRHNQTGLVRLMIAEEVREQEDQDRWEKLGAVDTAEGLTATAGEQLSIVRSILNDEQELEAFYQLEESPEILETTKLDRNVERFASFLSRPGVAALILFLAVFMLSTEMSTPGLGVPGFLSAICFMLFFWSQHLEGNAGWLEVLLFVGGVSFILIEIFVSPGIGLFGVGGIAMVIASMILASQEFSFTASDLEKLPKSLIPALGAAFGFFTALFVLRNVLPHSPVFKKMILAPRERAIELGSGASLDPEAIVDWSFLQGRKGEAATRLVPSGKARIDGRVYDVITDGRMVDKGQAIKVVEAIGNRVVVVPAD